MLHKNGGFSFGPWLWYSLSTTQYTEQYPVITNQWCLCDSLLPLPARWWQAPRALKLLMDLVTCILFNRDIPEFGAQAKRGKRYKWRTRQGCRLRYICCSFKPSNVSKFSPKISLLFIVLATHHVPTKEFSQSWRDSMAAKCTATENGSKKHSDGIL